MNKCSRPKCLGKQYWSLSSAGMTAKCLNCPFFDKCHKITVSVAMGAALTALILITENGLADGRLKTFEELEENQTKQSRKKK